MSANMIDFPRWRTLLPDTSRVALMRRVRMAARHAGATGADLPSVETYASALLDNGKDEATVVQAAQSYAKRISSPPASRA